MTRDDVALLRSGDAFPHVPLHGRDGTIVDYRTIWQRRNLLLVLLPPAGEDDYLGELDAQAAELAAHDTAVIVTRAGVPGAPTPGIVGADRWGEIFLVSDRLLPATEVIGWLRYAQMQCSACWGDGR